MPVTVVLHEHARPNAANVLAEIQALTSAESLASWNGTLNMQVYREDLERIARLDSVQAIEETTQAAPHNDRIMVVSFIKEVNDRLQAVKKPALTGVGQTVGLADTGVDITHDAFNKPQKVASVYYVTGELTDDDGHGTHVAGTILGDAVKNWEDKDLNGMAPGARLLVQGGIFRGKSWTAPDLFERAYNANGANCRVHNNSWGPKKLKKGNENQKPYKIDDAERVDEWALKHPDFLIIYSAGNDGGFKTTSGGGQVGAWVVAKNVLTVGASYTDRPINSDETVDYTVNPFTFKRGVASFSSRGPVLNTQRTKPDVVAPGNGILSARANTPGAIKEQKDWPDDYGKPPGGFKPGDKTIFCSGTSMAAPTVSGYAALLREALKQWAGVDTPSAPLMKALFINGTDNLNGTNNLSLPSTEQGYGEINMRRVLIPIHQPIADIKSGKAASGYAEGTARINQTELQVFKATVPARHAVEKTINLQVTLVYHDYWGDQIQNRMNLFVKTQKGKTETAPTTQYDNVHRLFMSNMTPGEVITIGVEPKLIFKETAPWGVVWEHFES